MIRNSSSARGFTLLELLVVIVVIAILISIGYPALIGALERAKVAKDMNNLRQLGLATQTYMNDNDGAMPGSTTVTWMSQLNPKYVSVWRSFQSPFDTRGSSELGDATTPVSYGIDAAVYKSGVAISASQITKPTAFIVYASAQASGTAVTFQGLATTGGPGVEVDFGGTPANSNPGGTAIGGTHSSRVKINALFADWHVENMSWAVYMSDAPDPGCKCPNGNSCTVSYRWHPDQCNP